MPTRARARKAQGSSSICSKLETGRITTSVVLRPPPTRCGPHCSLSPSTSTTTPLITCLTISLRSALVVLAALHSAGMSEDRRRMALARG